MNTLTSKQSNAVLAGNAFVARFKREPVSPSDAAWLNGFVIALESNTSETGELLSIARDLSTMDCFWSASGHHEADCKCLSGRAERAVAAHTQKPSEPRVSYNSNGDAYLVEPPPSSEGEDRG